MNQVSFGPAQISDIDQIKPLMESVFGPFQKIEELFTKWITQAQYNVVVAKVDGRLVGVSTWCLNRDNDLSKYECFGEQALEFMKSQRLAWAVNLAVYSEYRRQKIGQKLSLAQLKWLEAQDCTAVVGSSWVNGTNDHSQHLYLKAGFRRLGESGEFLRLQAQNGAVCSVCKTSECNCHSILYGVLTADLMKFAATTRA